MPFDLVSDFKPAGDQLNSIPKLVNGINEGKRDQVLLGVTGSGKTFTMANIIAQTGRSAIILAPNKTLAAQLYEEMKTFFPNDHVEYFVSYYDYYQPEAYIPHTDTYIEKDALVNDRIDRLRHSATRNLLENKNVIVVASVSCIYGIGTPDLYFRMTFSIKVGEIVNINTIKENLVELQYKRNDVNFIRGTFKVLGDTLSIFPSHYENRGWKISFFGNIVDSISEFDPLTGKKTMDLSKITVFGNSHYVTPRLTMLQAIEKIKQELEKHLECLRSMNKLVEAQRLEQRTNFDIEMMKELGSCKGIENYSRYLSGVKSGDPPPTLFQYLPNNALMFVDESHVSVPQIAAMYNGDKARKSVLVEHGFRLPSAMDNRPLKFEEWEAMRPQTIYVSATPGPYEIMKSKNEIVEQIIRPTGLLDPLCIIRPALTQVDDLISECREAVNKNFRVLVTTITKKMSETLAEYLQELNIKVTYLHSDINAIERIEIIHKLRQGSIDVLVGVNLLREGLDIPECGLVAILDADKEGFLRSETALIQTIGRAARNVDSKVIIYADKITSAIKSATEITDQRRLVQMKYNKLHGIEPKSVKKSISKAFENNDQAQQNIVKILNKNNDEYDIASMQAEMHKAAEMLDFELAASIRDKIRIVSSKIKRKY